MSDYCPLHEPGAEAPVYSLDVSFGKAREVLVEQQAANIYSAYAMVRAATQLEIALRELIASLDANEVAS